MTVLAWLAAWAQAHAEPVRRTRRRLRRWGAQHPRLRLLGRVLTVAVLVQAGVSSAAYAAAEDDKGGGNVFLDGFGISDSRGTPVSKYEMSLGGGGGGVMPGPSDFIDPVIQAWVVFGWEVYRIMVTFALWFLDLALQYRVLDLLRPAANLVAESLQSSVGALGVVPCFLVISFIAMVYWIGQRRAGAGILDFALSLLASALLASALANPVNWITGDDGLMANSRDVGIATAVQITSGGENVTADDEQLRRQTTGMLADNFIRTPHQLINYGAVIEDGSKCAEVYDKTINEGPYDNLDDAKKKLGKCDEAYETAADDPMQALTGMMVLSPAGGIVVILAGLLGLITLALNLMGLYLGAKNVLEILKACLPGSAKAGIVRSMASLAMLAVATILLLVLVGAFLVFVHGLFSGYKDVGLSLIEAFALLDMIMLLSIGALLVFWWKSHRAGKSLGDRLHKAIAPAPIAPAANDGRRAAAMITSKGTHVASIIQQRRSAAAMTTALSNGRTEQTSANPAATTATGRAAQPQRALLTRIGVGAVKGTGKAVKIGAMSTVGAPVYAPRAAAAAKGAIRAKKGEVTTSLQQVKTRAHTRAAQAGADARSFGHEYVHNLAAGARFVGKVSGATHLAGMALTAGVNPIAAGALAAGAMVGGSAGKTNPAPRRSAPTPQRAGTAPGRGAPSSAASSAGDFVVSMPKRTAGNTMGPLTTTQSSTTTSSPTHVPSVKASQSHLDAEEIRAGRERLHAKMREQSRSRARLPRAVGQ